MFRYTVTVGGTTFTVSKLKEAGYLRTTKEVADKMKDRKEDLRERYEERRDKVRKKLAENILFRAKIYASSKSLSHLPSAQGCKL